MRLTVFLRSMLFFGAASLPSCGGSDDGGLFEPGSMPDATGSQSPDAAPPARSCDDRADCADAPDNRIVCDIARGVCVECRSSADCVRGGTCVAGSCMPVDAGNAGTSGAGGAAGAGGIPSAGGFAGLAGSAGLADGGMCPAGMKACAGLCVVPNPAAGCGLVGCEPCPTPPANATAACNGEVCDFVCNEGFVRDVAGCVTATGGAGGTAGQGGAGGANGGSGGGLTSCPSAQPMSGGVCTTFNLSCAYPASDGGTVTCSCLLPLGFPLWVCQ